MLVTVIITGEFVVFDNIFPMYYFISNVAPQVYAYEVAN